MLSPGVLRQAARIVPEAPAGRVQEVFRSTGCTQSQQPESSLTIAGWVRAPWAVGELSLTQVPTELCVVVERAGNVGR